MKILRALTSCALVSMLAGYSPARAAAISGVVAEAEGEPVAKAEVMLMNADNRVILRKDYTDSRGAFRFAVKPGVFKIGAFKPTYSTAWIEGVAVRDADVSIRVELEPEAFVEHPSLSPDEEDCE